MFLTWFLKKYLEFYVKSSVYVHIMCIFPEAFIQGVDQERGFVPVNICRRSFLLDIHAAIPHDDVSKAINMLYAVCPSLWPVIFAISSIIYYFKNGFSQKGLGNKGCVCASIYGFKTLSNAIYHLTL